MLFCIGGFAIGLSQISFLFSLFCNMNLLDRLDRKCSTYVNEKWAAHWNSGQPSGQELSTIWYLPMDTGGDNFHYKGIYRCAAGMGYTFQVSQYMNGYHFYIKSIIMGYLFHPKSIWMGKIWKIVYEWGQFSKMVYEWRQFSIWEVYEWVMFFTWPGIWMGWGSGTPAAHPYPKSWQVTPPPVPMDCTCAGQCAEGTHELSNSFYCWNCYIT